MPHLIEASIANEKMRILEAGTMSNLYLHRCAGFIRLAVKLTKLGLLTALCVSNAAFASGVPGNLGAVTPSDLRGHYNIPNQYTGKGQTIIVVIWNLSPTFKSTTALASLNAFSGYFGLPLCGPSNPCFRVEDMSPSDTGDDELQSEALLDIEMAHAVAPAAQIVLLSMGADQAATNAKILQLHPIAVTMSWGSEETSSQTSTGTSCFCDGFFGAHPEVAFFDSISDIANYIHYPATSPSVTAVGGTHWSPLLDNGVESIAQAYGYGFSAFAAMPDYQKMYLLMSGSPVLGQSNGQRSIPDVSYQASGPTAIYDGGVSWAFGTSAATPQWAGIAALIAEAFASKGLSFSAYLEANGGLNRVLYMPAVASSFNHFSSTGFNPQGGLGAPNVGSLINAVLSGAQSTTSIISGAAYYLVNPNSNKALDVYARQTANGSAVDLWEQNGSVAQMWTINSNGDGTYTLVNPNSNKALDVYARQTANGSVVDLWGQNGSVAQKWTINSNGDGTYTLVNPNSYKALDVYGGATANQTKIDIWDINGSAAQKWKLIPTN